jgi:hypothetical protein
MSPQLESLEGKTLLSAGSAMQHVAPRLAAAPLVVQTESFSGTLKGPDSDVSVGGISHVVSFDTTGTLIGPGSTHLRGTLYGIGNPGRLLGQLFLRNSGGSMTVNVYRSATAGTFTDTVVRARGADTIYLGATGNLKITMSWTFYNPQYFHQQAMMTFIPA